MSSGSASRVNKMPPLFHQLFLLVLAVAVGLFFLVPTRRRGHNGRGLGLLFLIVFGALLIHQACWQLSGCGSQDFLAFRRLYDQRTAPPRGALLDRHGALLARLEGDQHLMPLGPAALHVVGYNSKKYQLSGLERVFDARMAGMTLPEHPSDLVRRSEAQDVTTTLDSTLQKAAFEALKGRRGAVILLQPKTGEILALASSPSAEAEDLAKARVDNVQSPLLNRALRGLYPPGSVFKIFTAALAYEQKRGGLYACPEAGWRPAPGTPPIRDTHASGASLTLDRAFAESSNIYFAKAARACGWPAFQAAATRCLLNQNLTLAQCGDRTLDSVKGVLPERQGQLVYYGFGQGDLRVTPMHIAALTASIANNGILVAPHLELSESKPKTYDCWSPNVAQRVRELMRGSVLRGTSRGIARSDMAVCGKTGTAENSGKDHAWFTCFAPAEDPQIVITVLVENGGFGAQTALPIARELLDLWAKQFRK